MKRKILAMLTCLAVMFTAVCPGTLAAFAEDGNTTEQAEASADDHSCTCGETAPENLANHADSCPRKQYIKKLITEESGKYKTAEATYADWAAYDADTQTDLLHMVEAYVATSYDALLALIREGNAENSDTTVEGVTIGGLPTGVLPAVKRIVPREISAKAWEKIGSHSLAFSLEIAAMDGTEPWQPESGTTVTVSLDAAEFGLDDGARIAVLHEHGGAVESLGEATVSDGKLTFETDGFSAFYGYTVDFEYDGTWYSVGGGSDVYLYELFAMLGIHRSDTEVTDVRVSDAELLRVGKVVSDGYTGEKAWMIHSLKAFDTEESMKISFSDGTDILLKVYDAHYTSFTSGKYTLNSGDSIGTLTLPNGSAVEIDLRGTVTVNGTINIGQGSTLTVTGNGTLQRASGFTDKMFYIAGGGKLIIKGTAENNIVIDGNASFASTPVADSTRKMLSVTGTEATSTAIYVGYEGVADYNIAATAGAVELQYVTMRNLYSTKQAPAIHVTGSQTDALHSAVTMDHVTVKKCATTSGDAILLLNDCVATMTHCALRDNYSGGTYAGVVKAGGSIWFAQLNMTDCTASGNYSAGWGGVVLWAANRACGEKSAKATIKNCTFTENTARWLGGALSNEAIMEVSGTTLQNNIAMAGGGIATFPFTLTESVTDGGEACGLTLGEGNVIQKNTAYASGNFTPYAKKDSGAEGDEDTIDKQITYTGGGGGVWCYMDKSAWTCSLEIGAGNTISANKAKNVGGGVYVDKVAGEATVLSVTGATIAENEAENGGGVAVKNADIKVKSGTIRKNTALKNGGGIFVESGSCAVSGAGSVDGNAAKNGGGIYIENGSIAVTGGIIARNQATGSYSGATAKTNADGLQGVGGGIFLKKGRFSLAGTNIGIYANAADTAANDVYASGNGTELILPEVKNMNLSGMVGEEKPNGWYADYKGAEAEYPQAVIGKSNPGRYEAGAEKNVEVLYSVLQGNKTTFYCLTLGLPHPG